MIPADISSLTDKIVRPGMDKHLVPLLLYRGYVSLGEIHRRWNFAINMMESECESFSEGVKLGQNPAFSHVAGIFKPQYMSLRSLFGRLRDNSRVTDNIPGLTAYCRDVIGSSFHLAKLSLYTNDPRCRAPWRIYKPKPLKLRKFAGISRATTSFYPYLIHKPKEGDGERELMLAVNSAVPKGLPDFLRADICQDLLLAILAGDIAQADLTDNVRSYTSRVKNMHPMKYGAMSLDDMVGPDDDRTGHELIVPDSYGGMEW